MSHKPQPTNNTYNIFEKVLLQKEGKREKNLKINGHLLL